MWSVVFVVCVLMWLLVWLLRHDGRQSEMIRDLRAQVASLEQRRPDPEMLRCILRNLDFLTPSIDPSKPGFRSVIIDFSTLASSIDFKLWLDRERLSARQQ